MPVFPRYLVLISFVITNFAAPVLAQETGDATPGAVVTDDAEAAEAATAEAAALLAEAEAVLEAARAEASAVTDGAMAEAEEILSAAASGAAEITAEADAEADALREEAMAEAETVLNAAASEAADLRSGAETEAAALRDGAEAEMAEMLSAAETRAENILAAARAEAAEIRASAQEAAWLAIEEERARIAAEEEAARLAAEEEARRAAEAAALVRAEAALDRCLARAGEPDARLAVSEEAQEAKLDATRTARRDCEMAVDGLPEEAAGPALFHLATAAQASGEHEDAVALYTRASEAGIAAADSRLGDYYLLNIGRVGQDIEAALGYYRAAAEADEPEAIRTLGLIHGQGVGVDRSARRMIEFLERSAALDYHFAQFVLGRIYLTGEGVPNREQRRLGVPDVDRALALLQEATNNGNTQAALLVAEVFSGGGETLPQDDAARFRWTQAAADTGLAEAIAALGFLYEQGIGVEADPQVAANAYIRALEAGADPNDLRGTVNGVQPAWDRPTAVAFQQLLIDRGLYNGPLDGIVGAGTLAGARALSDG